MPKLQYTELSGTVEKLTGNNSLVDQRRKIVRKGEMTIKMVIIYDKKNIRIYNK